MADSNLAVERRGGVVWCALDRPPLSLLEPGLIGLLRSTFETLARDASVRAAVVTGRGRAFTAGMDVNVLRDLDAASARALITELCAAIDAVHRAPFPVVAAVHGACLGAGFELALACDLRVAAANASFGLPEVRVGVPSVIQAALLPPLIGPGRAAEMLLLGTPVDAPRAPACALSGGPRRGSTRSPPRSAVAGGPSTPPCRCRTTCARSWARSTAARPRGCPPTC